jgi:putative peptidoglycan lipid II flippase
VNKAAAVEEPSIKQRIRRFFDKKETVKEAVVKSSGINFLTRFVGYLKYLCIAVFIGFNRETDAFFMASGLLGMFMVFVDVFDSVGVPNLVRAKKQSEEEFRHLASNLFALTLILGVLVTLGALLASPFIARIAFGFSAHRQTYVRIFFLILIPELFFAFLFHHFGAILRSDRKFTIFFVGQFIFGTVSTLTLFLTLPFFHQVWIIPASFSLAQIAAAIFIAYYAREHFHVKLEWNEQTKNMVKQIGFLSCLYALMPLYTLADNAFASYLPQKTISALNYGMMIALVPASILQFSVIAITPLSEQEADWGKLKQYLRFLILFSLPVIVGSWLFITPVLKLFMGYGRFSSIDLGLTAEAVRYYSLILPFALGLGVLYRAYQIKNRYLPLILFSISGAISNVVCKDYFIFHLHLAIRGIAISTLIGYILIYGGSYWYLRGITRVSAK